ncbi:cyclin B1 interacting protein-like protein 1 [Halenospora varia]|nr:cyclin B1 interacting protein-like protein 1 [Halenospora varia]
MRSSAVTANMEFVLRCNNLKCRKEVSGHAVVTTCSHVFCIDCSNRYQLSGVRDSHAIICPACDGHLRNPDDIVVANLNPTEDYKTSVLSGLSPNIVMECAGRALSWWAYQTSQEIIYQGCMSKSLSEQYNTLNIQMDKIINDANSEISNLRNKLATMETEQESLRRKNEEITQALREKSRKQLHAQEMYDRLRRQNNLGQVQNAASEAIGNVIQASVTATRHGNRTESQDHLPPAPPVFSSQRSMQLPNQTVMQNNMAPPIRSNREDTWAGFSIQGSTQPNLPIQTPSTHRQPLRPSHQQFQTQQQPTPRLDVANFQPNAGTMRSSTGNFQSNNPLATPMQQSRPSPRAPLANLNNSNASAPPFAGYGMSAGLKVSNPTGATPIGVQRPLMRSRVAHRSPSGFQAIRDSAFGPPSTNMFSNGNNFY